MESKVYKYMDWPEIEAVVYAEEASPKDLMTSAYCRWYSDPGIFSGCREGRSSCR